MKKTLLLAALAAAIHGQALAAQPEVSARVIPQKTAIGDELRYYARFTAPADHELEPLSETAALAPFEIKRIEQLPARVEGDRVTRTLLLTLTVFELGDLSVPPLRLRYTDGAGRRAEIYTPPVKVSVRATVKTAQGAAPPKPRPIKGPAYLDLGRYRQAALLGTALLLALLLAVKIALRRWRRGPVDPESLKPAHERALLELGRLRKCGHLAARRTKEHYSGLSDILRRYLDRRFGMETADRTTSEILSAAKAAGLEDAAIASIRRVAETSDLVKFAKHEPKIAETEEVERTLMDLVEATRPRPEEARK